MEILFDETYPSEDGKRTSRNIWYGYANISTDGKYGKEISLGNDFMELLVETIKKDLSNSTSSPTETNWYFYGKDVTQDAIGDTIRSTIMVRERSGEFITNINISDSNFALNIDAVLLFKSNLEKKLSNIGHG